MRSPGTLRILTLIVLCASTPAWGQAPAPEQRDQPAVQAAEPGPADSTGDPSRPRLQREPPVRDIEALPGQSRLPGRRAETAPPPAACYRAASAGSGDAYDCDLAVQVARDSGSPEALAAALNNRGLVLAAEGRLEPALADLDAAIAAAPDDAAIYGNRGNLLLRAGRPAEALADHDRAVALTPRDPVAYYNRAFSHLALAHPLQAEQDVAAARALLEQRSRITGSGTPAPAGDRSR